MPASPLPEHAVPDIGEDMKIESRMPRRRGDPPGGGGRARRVILAGQNEQRAADLADVLDVEVQPHAIHDDPHASIIAATFAPSGPLARW